MKNYYLLLFLFIGFFGKAQIINFPDANFKAKLLEASANNEIAANLTGNYFKIDTNNNGEIEINEAINVSSLDVNNLDETTGNPNTNLISSLIGIEYFTNIINLNCYCNNISALNLNSLVNLKYLNCGYNSLTNFTINNPLTLIALNYSKNQISNLNLNPFLNLINLDCSFNQIQNLNLNNLSSLLTLECSNNQLTTLNVNNSINLSILNCTNNFLASLDLTQNIHISRINCNYNSLTSLLLPLTSNVIAFLNCTFNLLTDLTVTKINAVLCNNNLLTNINFLYPEDIKRFKCQNNNFITLDLSTLTNPSLREINLSNNPNLIYLNIKNGLYNYNPIIAETAPYNPTALDISNCPNLQFICVDEILDEILNIQGKINYFGYTNCNFNSYCSFVPGGQFYTIQGQQKFDNENDSCDSNDNAIPNFKLAITNGITTGSIVSNNTGNYFLPVQAGTHTITPILENPTYFTVSPPNVVVNFPSQTSPFTQNFCITANGIKHDVEITILPLNPARSGFDCNYKIVYKNKGNQTENGTINVAFDDSLFDFVSSSVATSSQTFGNLNWNYSNLQPFETREIIVVLNLNSPLETPAVNAGDLLSFTATNTITNTDEMISDNTFVLNQIVVNSFDPNDKTCLQGNYVGPDRIGEFVHYMIRFENTGNFPAENIVVKDMIDTTKFDVSSLVPLQASHNYFTRITGTNKVEFIFENINLPFDDANNDGYVAFKIKTLPSLVVGNTFSNSANIYFDYNFPIVTNTATTNIVALSNPSFEFTTYFSLYPNPTTSELNINLKSAVEINSIQIYNTIGQLVTVQTGNALKVDVSHLKTGNYFIKINTNEGFSTSQFIKE